MSGASFIKLDSTNIVPNGLNNTFTYHFPGSSVNFQNIEFAIQSISMFNSQYNIDAAAFNNNTFKLEVPTAATTSTISVSLPDGIYSYADINREIQTALVNAGAYLIDDQNDNVFYIQLTENSIYYAAQVDMSPTPTALPSGWSKPATGLYSTSGTGLPTTTRVPRLIIDNSEFGKLLGLSLGTYPSASATVAKYQLSNIIPEIHPSSSYVIHCDLVKNEFDSTGTITACFDRGTSVSGQLIRYQPSQYVWCSTHDGSRATVTVRIFDQNDRPVHFRDQSVSIMLIFRKQSPFNRF